MKGTVMQVKVMKVHPDAKLPVYSTEGAGCFDISAVEIDNSPDLNCKIMNPNKTALIRTGLSFEVPENHVMLIFSRSGHGFKQDIRLANCVGVIDSDYRGELMVKLTKDETNSNFNESVICKGDRIAQGMIIAVNQVRFELVHDLKETARGVNGFGSTGV